MLKLFFFLPLIIVNYAPQFHEQPLHLPAIKWNRPTIWTWRGKLKFCLKCVCLNYFKCKYFLWFEKGYRETVAFHKHPFKDAHQISFAILFQTLSSKWLKKMHLEATSHQKIVMKAFSTQKRFYVKCFDYIRFSTKYFLWDVSCFTGTGFFFPIFDSV